MIKYNYQYNTSVGIGTICTALESGSSLKFCNTGNDTPTEVNGFISGGGKSWIVAVYENTDTSLVSSVPIVVKTITKAALDAIMTPLG